MLSSDEWFGFYAPVNTPPVVVRSANEALRVAMRDPGVIESLAALGLVPTPSSPEEMAESQRSQTERWGPLVRKIGFTADS